MSHVSKMHLIDFLREMVRTRETPPERVLNGDESAELAREVNATWTHHFSKAARTVREVHQVQELHIDLNNLILVVFLNDVFCNGWVSYVRPINMGEHISAYPRCLTELDGNVFFMTTATEEQGSSPWNNIEGNIPDGFARSRA